MPLAKLGDPLNSREIEVLKWASQGFSNKQIGSRVGIALNTVKTYKMNIHTKLDVHTTMEAVIRGLQMGLIQVEGLVAVPPASGVMFLENMRNVSIAGVSYEYVRDVGVVTAT